MNSDGIERLAEHVGVTPWYTDHEGKRRDTSRETRAALLEAMGFAVRSDAEADEQLAALLDASRKRLFDPVVVQEYGLPHRIHVRGPRRAGALRWRVEIRSERGRVAAREGVHDAAAPLEIEAPILGVGYYDVRLLLTTAAGERSSSQLLIVVPARCLTPSALLGDRPAFGVFANLYTLRGAENWGVGDTRDLTELIRWVGEIGGSFVGLNPLHTLLNRGSDISPYGPVSRLWRNPLYIDVESVPELADAPELRERIRSPEVAARLEALRASPHVQYDQVWATKALALDALHDVFVRRQERGASHPRVAAYQAFVQAAGRELSDHATWMAIAESRDEWAWQQWPADLQDPRSESVRRFARSHAKRVEFHQWLQFELDRQLGDAAAASRQAGLEIGLYQDLAVGSAGGGSDAWANRNLFLDGVSVGAPPDAYSDVGQNWGFPPVNPLALRDDRYRYFIALVRAGLRHAGALRIDHVMGLFRLFWIPRGASGKDGAYVRYPADDLLGILALESLRHRALIVGEDLGVVPPEVRPAMEKWSILSSRVLYFERDGHGFRRQADYPQLSLASANTHDMPTIGGFWSGRDIELRAEFGLIEPARVDAVRAERAADKHALVDRLREDGALPLAESVPDDVTGVPAARAAVHTFLAESPAMLVGISLDDLGDETEPVNVPGVGADKYPCWSRRMHKSIAEVAATAGEDLRGCASRARVR